MFASAEVQTKVLELSPAGSTGPAWDRGPISDIEPTAGPGPTGCLANCSGLTPEHSMGRAHLRLPGFSK